MKKYLILFLLIIYIIVGVSSCNADVTLCGDTFLLFDSGRVNATFIDSCITINYVEYNTGNDYIIFDDLRLDIDTSSIVYLNFSVINSTSLPSKDQSVLRFNATHTGADVSFQFVGNTTRGVYDVYIGGSKVHDGKGPNSFGFTVSSWSKKDIDIKFAGVQPKPPVYVASDYNESNLTFCGNWTRNTGSDKEVVIRNDVWYVTSPSGGTEVQNSTSLSYCSIPGDSQLFYNVWSYNTTYGLFSGVGTTLPYTVSVVNWSIVSDDWWGYLTSGYDYVFGNWIIPIVFFGIIGYVYCVNRSALSAAAIICIIFAVFGVTGVFRYPEIQPFFSVSIAIAVLSIAGMGVLLFTKKGRND